MPPKKDKKPVPKKSEQVISSTLEVNSNRGQSDDNNTNKSIVSNSIEYLTIIIKASNYYITIITSLDTNNDIGISKRIINSCLMATITIISNS